MGYQRFGRTSHQRKAMFRSLTTSLFKEGRILTTEVKAKELSSIAEKLITKAKKGDLHARRQVLAYVYEEDVVRKLFDEIAPKYEERNGGYTRIIKANKRAGDGAETAIIELV